jgi:hypothetical protein
MDCYRMAAKNAHKRFDTMADHNWLEMGVLSINIFARTAPDGKIIIEMYVLRILGYNSLITFIDMIKLRRC